MKGISKLRVSVLASTLLSLAMVSCSHNSISSEHLHRQDSDRVIESSLPVNLEHRRLAIGASAVVGVREDGSVWSWGNGRKGELGNGLEYSSNYQPTAIQGMKSFVEVAGSETHFLALRSDGTVWSWGNNDRGQLGYETNGSYSAVPRQIPDLNNIVSVAASDHSLVLDSKGNLYSFGSNESMQLGFYPANKKVNFIPNLVLSDRNAVKVYARRAGSALLRNDGVAFAWGGGLFMGGLEPTATPMAIRLESKIVDLAISDALYILTSDGNVFAQSGNNNMGQLGQGDFVPHNGLVKVKGIGNVISIGAKNLSGIALDRNGAIWQWGNSVRFRSIETLKVNREPIPVKLYKIPDAKFIEANTANAVFTDDGSLYFWGNDEGRHAGDTPENNQGSHWSTPHKSIWKWK